MQVNEFDQPFIAASYDIVDGPREDLDLYVAVARELGARSVLDVGCGTGTLALRLAAEGYAVTALDPAGAMLQVARAKPGAGQVGWVHGTVTDLLATVTAGPAGSARPADHEAVARIPADLAVMTGNVAQVFLGEEDWLAALRAVHGCLAAGGHLLFETRIPDRRAWEDWAQSGRSTHHVPGVGEVVDTFELVSVDLPFVTFRSENRLPDGSVVAAESTLIFRSLEEIRRTLGAAGFAVVDVRDAPDRPGREWVVLARRS